MGRDDSFGANYPSCTRMFKGKVYELYITPNMRRGSNKALAQRIAKGLRNAGERARVIKWKNKYWVYSYEE